MQNATEYRCGMVRYRVCSNIPQFTHCQFWQIFRIGTVRYAEGLWRMRRHKPRIAHCTDSEDFPQFFPICILPISVSTDPVVSCWNCGSTCRWLLSLSVRKPPLDGVISVLAGVRILSVIATLRLSLSDGDGRRSSVWNGTLPNGCKRSGGTASLVCSKSTSEPVFVSRSICPRAEVRADSVAVLAPNADNCTSECARMQFELLESFTLRVSRSYEVPGTADDGVCRWLVRVAGICDRLLRPLASFETSLANANSTVNKTIIPQTTGNDSWLKTAYPQMAALATTNAARYSTPRVSIVYAFAPGDYRQIQRH